MHKGFDEANLLSNGSTQTGDHEPHEYFAARQGKAETKKGKPDYCYDQATTANVNHVL